MDLNEFVNMFAECFDDTDASEISATTIFRDLDEWSSLTSLSIIAMAKTEYDKTITGMEIRACKTVSDVYNLVKNK